MEERTGIHHSSVITLAAVETVWGRYTIPESNNLFNLRDDIDWMGETVDVVLPVKIGGKYVHIAKKFKRYYSLDDSIVDLAIQMKKEVKTLRTISASRSPKLFMHYLRLINWTMAVPNDPKKVKAQKRHDKVVRTVLAALAECNPASS